MIRAVNGAHNPSSRARKGSAARPAVGAACLRTTCLILAAVLPTANGAVLIGWPKRFVLLARLPPGLCRAVGSGRQKLGLGVTH